MDRSLLARMAFATALLGVVALAFTVALVAGFGALAVFFGWPMVVAPVGAAVVLLGFGALELTQGARVVREADAYEVDADTSPRLHRIVRIVAQQADLPMLAIAVSDDDAPEAFVTGYTAGSATLVISLGMLRALDDAELRAVVAHELAHVKNRDVALMTAISVPTAVASRLHELSSATSERLVGSGGAVRGRGLVAIVAFLSAVVSLVAGLFSFLGRSLIASFSRVRELAADRGAVAITGDPASLASALSSIETELGKHPVEDLRSAQSVAAFTVVSPEQVEPDEPLMLGAEGDQPATLTYYSDRYEAFVYRTFLRTHPSVGDRVSRLQAAEREVQTATPP
ncbi:M48 family metalloprotease [Haloprofundus salinisoli]|uniref:M48 family metalloprotease n=1 Tax=Haloprofundus salinisoli TaxID=2876193 RepID=UPI001CCD2A59|nr:M48 family metalloprotease [Haloprofundus salinisoli]